MRPPAPFLRNVYASPSFPRDGEAASRSSDRTRIGSPLHIGSALAAIFRPFGHRNVGIWYGFVSFSGELGPFSQHLLPAGIGKVTGGCSPFLLGRLPFQDMRPELSRRVLVNFGLPNVSSTGWMEAVSNVREEAYIHQQVTITLINLHSELIRKLV